DLQSFGVSEAGQRPRLTFYLCDAFESLSMFQPIKEVPAKSGIARVCSRDFFNPNEPFRVRVRERTQDESIHYAKNCGVCSDSQSEGENCNRCEPRVL